jgi:hypothetical protein
VVAFVAVSGLPAQGSRLFRLSGPASDPRVDELPSATTIDLARFDLDTKADLEPAADQIRALGGQAAISRPSPAWVAGRVRAFLKETEGLDVD